MNVFACHLLNDYSGSPKVLRQLIHAWKKHGIRVTVVTCSGRQGFLSDIDGIGYSYYWYQWSAKSFVRLVNFLLSQLLLSFKIWKMAGKGDIIYVNTVLPFGAALAGKLKGCKVVYHIHETTVKPKVLKKFLFAMVRLCASDAVYVSNYLKSQEPIKNVNSHLLYNALEKTFSDKAAISGTKKPLYNHVLMICSLKSYKGVFEFIALANRNSDFQFRLVVNATQQEINTFFEQTTLPGNLAIYPTQLDTHRFYQWADVVLNLSRPDGWVETFGLTILEAMAYQLPTIVPPVGGVTELVDDGENGFLVDSRDIDTLSQKLNEILRNKALYHRMQDGAFWKATHFSEAVFGEKSIAMLMQ